jgi:hypothetical protein
LRVAEVVTESYNNSRLVNYYIDPQAYVFIVCIPVGYILFRRRCCTDADKSDVERRLSGVDCPIMNAAPSWAAN